MEGGELKLKLENIIQSTNSLDFSNFTKINNDKNNNDSRSAKLIDSKQEVNSEPEDSELKSESTDAASVSSEQSAISISADQSQGKTDAIVKPAELNDQASEPVRTADSADTNDPVNDLSIISSTNLSSINSSFDSASFSTTDNVILNSRSVPANGTPSTASPSTQSTDSPDSSPPKAVVLNSTPSDEKSSAPSESIVKPDSKQNSKDPPAVHKPVKESGKPDSIKNTKHIKDDSYKKDRSFFPSLPKSSSAETISKLKSNISSVSTNSSNLFNKTIITISSNLLPNITNKSRRTADAKKQPAANQTHQDTRKQEVDRPFDKQAASSAAHSSAHNSAANPSGKQPVRAQTIDEERIMNEHAEDYGSLNCDHEPGLEFDDSELEQAAKLEDGKHSCTISQLVSAISRALVKTLFAKEFSLKRFFSNRKTVEIAVVLLLAVLLAQIII